MQPEALFHHVATVDQQRKDSGKLYLEFVRVPAISAGIYTLPAGSQDPQKPHQQDELYYIVRGRGHFSVNQETRDVGAGSVIFVAAKADHRFHDIVEELVVLVVFAPAET
jgi:mannose-6-phosphate isomerase-like protein (cupin superfamily)